MISAGIASAQSLLIDSSKSTIAFQIEHLSLLTVEGRFKNYKTDIEVEENEWDLRVQILTKSIQTGDKNRDENLIGSQYLNCEEFPLMLFNGNGFKAEDSIVVKGNLKIRGEERAVHFTMIEQDPFHFICENLILSRTFFNLDFGLMDLLVGDEIRVKLDIYLYPGD